MDKARIRELENEIESLKKAVKLSKEVKMINLFMQLHLAVKLGERSRVTFSF